MDKKERKYEVTYVYNNAKGANEESTFSKTMKMIEAEEYLTKYLDLLEENGCIKIKKISIELK